MKNKDYRFNEEKHDITKITRCLYTKDNVAEINNPISAVAKLQLKGEETVDQQVRRILDLTLARKAALLERNSIEDPDDMFDFDLDAEDNEQLSAFEIASEALQVQQLKAREEQLSKYDEPPVSDEPGGPEADPSPSAGPPVESDPEINEDEKKD